MGVCLLVACLALAGAGRCFAEECRDDNTVCMKDLFGSVEEAVAREKFARLGIWNTAFDGKTVDFRILPRQGKVAATCVAWIGFALIFVKTTQQEDNK